MAQATGIEWTDATWNPVVGCTKVSPGCKNCYAKTLHDQRHTAHKAGKKVPDQYAEPFEVVQLMPDRLTDPLSWRKPRRVFVNSVSDLFHDDVPDEFLDRVFAVMALASRHTFQVLTKRAERLQAYFSKTKEDRGDRWSVAKEHIEDAAWKICGHPEVTSNHWTKTWPIHNVWLGVSVENQDAADKRIPLLLQTPAAVRFLSCEPLLGPIRLDGPAFPDEVHRRGCWLKGYPERLIAWTKINWVIVGGESGPGARPMHPDWARSLRDQCQAAGVSFFFKQWGEWVPYEHDAQPPFLVSQHGNSVDGHLLPHNLTDRIGETVNGWMLTDTMDLYCRVGKKAAGRLLDGREWSEFPEVRS